MKIVYAKIIARDSLHLNQRHEQYVARGDMTRSRFMSRWMLLTYFHVAIYTRCARMKLGAYVTRHMLDASRRHATDTTRCTSDILEARLTDH